MEKYACRSVSEYEKLCKLGQGTYGTVYKARDKLSGQIVALKKIKSLSNSKHGFPRTSLREIHLLNQLSHPNLIQLLDVAVGLKPESVFLVFEFCEHDFSQLIQKMSVPFSIGQIKRILLQLLSAVKYLHDNFVMHRDLKLSNVLMNEVGVLKLADLGLARSFGRPLQPSTPNVVSLWYRAPELLLGEKCYTPNIDMWAIGCIFGELMLKRPLFRGSTELGQIDDICRILGTPGEREWSGLGDFNCDGFGSTFYTGIDLFVEFPKLSGKGMDLLLSMLQFDPARRIGAGEAMRHSFFEESPLATEEEDMGVFVLNGSNDTDNDHIPMDGIISAGRDSPRKRKKSS